MGKTLTDEELEKRMAEEIWLNYFNQYLLEHGTISEKEYQKIIELIAIRKSKRSLQRDARQA
jgi:hypothetical protein